VFRGWNPFAVRVPKRSDMPTGKTMVHADAENIRTAIGLLEPKAMDIVITFYDDLFLRRPDTRALFQENLTPQRERLLKALLFVVQHYGDWDKLKPTLAAMGRAHARFDLGMQDYQDVGEVLLGALEKFAGAYWTEDMAASWERVYTYCACIMLAASVTVDQDPKHALTV
jgi:hemoglobin-like flavoprotein